MARDDIAPEVRVWIEAVRADRFYDLLDPDSLAYNPAYLPIAEAKARGGSPAAREMPGLMTQAINVGSAIIRHVSAGMPIVSDEARAARLAICEGCDRHSEGRCLECGCVLAVKAAWELEGCPLGKWPK